MFVAYVRLLRVVEQTGDEQTGNINVWPPAFVSWVVRSFAACQSHSQRQAVGSAVSARIMSAMRTGTLLSTLDWAATPLAASATAKRRARRVRAHRAHTAQADQNGDPADHEDGFDAHEAELDRDRDLEADLYAIWGGPSDDPSDYW